MKISIENLGPLTHAEFDLKPLTVFIGDNRQGKTQAIVTTTTMLSDYGLNAFMNRYLNHPELGKFEEIEKLYADLTTSGQAGINLIEFSEKNIRTYYNDLGRLTPQYLSNILGYTISTRKIQLSYTLSSQNITEISAGILNSNIEKSQSGSVLQVTKELGDPRLYIYIEPGKKLTLPKSAVIHILLQLVIGTLHKIYCPNLYLFPSERAGFALLLTQIQQPPNISAGPQSVPPIKQENEQNLLPYSLAQYMGLIHSSLLFGSLQQRKEHASQRPNVAKLLELTELLNIITQDKITLSKSEPSLPRKIQITVNERVMDVQAASSGVKSLIGLSLYLQYKAQPRDLIVIDEPEQNLHPNQQAAFAEFLAILVNNGIRVAITTHSPYIIEHLQNLILAHDLKDKKEIINSLYLKREDAFISKENVGVYLFQNGTAENILMEDGEINWQTFCDTANTIGNITSLVYDKQHEERELQTHAAKMSVAEDKPEYR